MLLFFMFDVPIQTMGLSNYEDKIWLQQVCVFVVINFIAADFVIVNCFNLLSK